MFSLVCAAALLSVAVSQEASVYSSANDIIVQAATDGDVILTDGDDRVTLADIKGLIVTLNAALQDVETLKGNVTDLATKLEDCQSRVTDLETLTDEHDRSIGTLTALTGKITNVEIKIENTRKMLNEEVTENEESFEGIDRELTSLSDRIDELTNNTSVSCPPIGSLDVNSVVHNSILQVKHVVGFQLTLRCKPGFTIFETKSISCFPSGHYCDAAGFPTTDCTKSIDMPKCQPCPAGCKLCESSTKCIECDDKRDGKELFLLNGKCVSESPCSDYDKAKALVPGVTRGVPIALKNGKSTTRGVCLMDDDSNVYEAFPCYDLLNPGQRCTPTSMGNQENTCSEKGYMLLSFRNQKHYKLMYQAYKNLFSSHVRTTGVYFKQDSHPVGRPYTKCAMNSKSDSLCSKDWGVADGGDWWISETPYTEPNGDAQKFWYLRFDSFNEDKVVAFNDFRHAISTGNFYFCMQKQ
eukprot:m.20389 g.20389  ORF g.20389 m.20389 type:complete len:468 (+) comp6834_c0_seq1:42-1445(+)